MVDLLFILGLGFIIGLIFSRVVLHWHNEPLRGKILQNILLQLNTQQVSRENNLCSTIQNRFSETSQSLNTVQEMLTKIKEDNKRALTLSCRVDELRDILKVPKTRGISGEFLLEKLLAQIFPKQHFSTKFRFKDGSICDAVLHVHNNRLISIDSKFPLENFRKRLDASDDAEVKKFTKCFHDDVKCRINEISKKYILPAEGTLDFAFMFIPAENVYYHTFVDDKSSSDLYGYAFEKKVVPVSPNTLCPFLEIVLFGLRGLDIEKNARKIYEGLLSVTNKLKSFEQEYSKAMTKLKRAQKNLAVGEPHLKRAQEELTILGNQIEEDQK